MGFDLLPVVIVVAGAAIVLLVLARVPDASDRTLDRPSRERIDERLTEFFGPVEADEEGVRWDGPVSRFAKADPRIRLWRDTSAVLMIVGIAIIGVTLVNGQPPTGAVLEATATPEPQEPTARTPAPSTSSPSPETRPEPVPASASASGSDGSNEATGDSPSPDESGSPGAGGTPSPAGTPSPERLALLTPCPNEADCFLYEIRRGDNVSSVAVFFGISSEELLARNPDITNPSSVRAGQVIRIPTPRR